MPLWHFEKPRFSIQNPQKDQSFTLSFGTICPDTISIFLPDAAPRICFSAFSSATFTIAFVLISYEVILRSGKPGYR